MARWLRFNAVGIAGMAVQLGVLWFCTSALRLPVVLATMLAVEAALLHNFAWHEAWTWRGMPVSGRWRRLLRFHAANGLVSLTLNPWLTWLVRDQLGVPLLASNVIASGITALINFILADAWVFREGSR